MIPLSFIRFLRILEGLDYLASHSLLLAPHWRSVVKVIGGFDGLGFSGVAIALGTGTAYLFALVHDLRTWEDVVAGFLLQGMRG